MNEEKLGRLNGIANRSAIAGWVVALLPGRAVIGCPIRALPERGHIASLSPVFGFDGGLVQVPGPGGRTGVACSVQVTPLLGLVSLDSIDIPPGTPLVALDLLHERELAGVAAQVAQCREMLVHMRAGLSGIQLATAGVKLPPMRHQ